MSTFEELGVCKWICQALRAVSITTPTEIQRACIPPIVAGQSVIGGARTGSGKTAAFAVPILQDLSQDPYGVFAVVFYRKSVL
jgi:ATP-dependent RNA helicase DDX49/DBP8